MSTLIDAYRIELLACGAYVEAHRPMLTLMDRKKKSRDNHCER
jgi:hypothetical protein